MMANNVSVGPSGLPLDVANRIDEVCDGFEAEWRAGRRPRIEDFLHAEDEVTFPVVLRELLAADVARRLRLGEAPQCDDYLGRFPGADAVVHAAFDRAASYGPEVPDAQDPPGPRNGSGRVAV